MRRHLMQCDACRAEEQALRTLLDEAAALPEEIAPPRDLWQNIAPRLESRTPAVAPAERLDEVRVIGPRPVRPLPWWMLAAASIALVVTTSFATLRFSGAPGDGRAGGAAGAAGAGPGRGAGEPHGAGRVPPGRAGVRKGHRRPAGGAGRRGAASWRRRRWPRWRPTCASSTRPSASRGRRWPRTPTARSSPGCSRTPTTPSSACCGARSRSEARARPREDIHGR